MTTRKTCLSVAGLAALLFGAVAAQPCRAADGPPATDEAEAIHLLMRRDMFYCADDRFGKDRDLGYCDSVQPTPPVVAPVEVVVLQPQPAPVQKVIDNHGSKKDTQAPSTGPSPEQTPGQTPGDTPIEPPTEPPPEPPVEPPEPPPPDPDEGGG